jgi:hypothetical protein
MSLGRTSPTFPGEKLCAALIEETIQTSPWMPAELGRLDCRKNFPYGKEWNGKVYATKQVRPIFAEEPGVPQAEFTERSRRQ